MSTYLISAVAALVLGVDGRPAAGATTEPPPLPARVSPSVPSTLEIPSLPVGPSTGRAFGRTPIALGRQPAAVAPVNPVEPTPSDAEFVDDEQTDAVPEPAPLKKPEPPKMKTTIPVAPKMAPAGPVDAAPIKAEPITPAPTSIDLGAALSAPPATPSWSATPAATAAGCGPCGLACIGPELWFAKLDYLVWATKGSRLPVIATFSPENTPRDVAGILDQPRVAAPIGGGVVGGEARSGLRFLFGGLVSEERKLWFQAGGFSLGDGNDSFLDGSEDGSRIIARPFFNSQTGDQDAELISFPDVRSGFVAADYETNFGGAEAAFRWNLCCGETARKAYRLDFLAGYRYLRLNDTLTINSRSTALEAGGPIAEGTTVFVRDQFRTENDFHGGDFGLAWSTKKGKWTMESTGRLGLGASNQMVFNAGWTTTDPRAGATTTTAGGLLVQRTNAGVFERTDLAVVPELDLTFSYELSSRAKIGLGYTFLYLSDAARAVDQVDGAVNPSVQGGGRVIGPTQPLLQFESTDFWAQGLNIRFDLEF
ncbi:MAG: BBP7 family outer membrane beta-barrel protein [Planctomycetia bacterium]